MDKLPITKAGELKISKQLHQLKTKDISKIKNLNYLKRVGSTHKISSKKIMAIILLSIVKKIFIKIVEGKQLLHKKLKTYFKILTQ